MDVILKEDIRGLGYKNDIVQVKPGYGRNYLIPQGFAILATPGNRKTLAENLRQAAHKLLKIKESAQLFAENIGDLKLEIRTKAGETGKIFGAVTAIQVSKELEEKGFKIDRKKISFQEEIKFLGDYEVVLDLHKEVQHSIGISVIQE